MTVREEARCACETPVPVGPTVIGVRKCARCGKVANWRDWVA